MSRTKPKNNASLMPPTSSIQPLELPFPIDRSLPLGVGTTERKAMYDIQDEMKSASGHNTTAFGMIPLIHQNEPEPAVSPFVSLDSPNEGYLDQEQDSWFLVQLPTRLPPLKQNAVADRADIVPSAAGVDGIIDVDNPNANNLAADGTPIEGAIAEVITPPVVANSFDNSLVNAAPGRLGKILVYKSGKTVLVMDGPDGTGKVRLSEREC